MRIKCLLCGRTVMGEENRVQICGCENRLYINGNYWSARNKKEVLILGDIKKP